MGFLCCIHGLTEEEFAPLAEDPEALEDWFEEGNDVSDLDKAWHGIHFLLTRSPWEGDPPLNFLLHGGEPIAGSDEGYGPARFFPPTKAVVIHKALQRVPEDQLRSRFDAEQFINADIYPRIWHERAQDQANLDYLMHWFRSLKEHVGHLAKERKGFIVSIR